MSIDLIKKQFRTPPDDARVMTRWWWFGPGITEAGLERDMLAMKEAGIGGFEIAFEYPAVPEDPENGIVYDRFLSPTFLEKITYVSRRALELGLRMDITIGSGWSYGGRYIGQKHAARHLRSEVREIAPDMADIARPIPYEGEELLGIYVGEGSRQEPPRAWHHVELRNEGRIALPPSLGPRLLVFYFDAPTGQVVKRAALGAEGYILDHYSSDALAVHLRECGDKLLAAAVPGSVHAIFTDSLEVYGSDWSRNMPEVFKARRGYDLEPLLPYVEFDAGEESLRVRRDLGLTLSELYEENFLVPMKAWAVSHGVKFRIQNYGFPPGTISSSRHADLIEGEGWGWRSIPETRWAVSAGHLFDKPVISSETWTWVHSPSFRATLLDLQGEAHEHFLIGINQLIAHGWPYSPPNATAPGWYLYAAGALNDRNPWSPVMADLYSYLHRTSFLLRQGAPVCAIGLYSPNLDAFSSFVKGTREYQNLWSSVRKWIGPEIVGGILDAGLNFDLFDDGTLSEASARGFKAIVLPRVQMLPETSRIWLERFVRDGGLVIAVDENPLPEIAAVRTVSTDELAQSLGSLVQSDISFALANPALGAIKRSLPDADIFFIANTGNLLLETDVTLNTRFPNVEIWDATTGESHVCGQEGGLRLSLEPYQAAILVCSGRAAASPLPASADTDAIPLDGEWGFTLDNGRDVMVRLPHDWSNAAGSEFYSGMGRYECSVDFSQFKLDRHTRVWIDFGACLPVTARALGQLAIRGRSFTATIEPPIREAAIVHVNGVRTGSLWAPPYRLDITEQLHAGINHLSIDVFNTMINFLAAPGNGPDDSAVSALYGRRMRLQDFDNLKRLSSGLCTVPKLVFTKVQRKGS